jgi:Ca2+-binding RTX toxin-like protein
VPRGGARRDVLVGGAGADRLGGDGDDDLLIAGAVTFDGRDLPADGRLWDAAFL